MIKILGILDFASAIIILLAHFSLVPWNIILGVALYLVLKGIIFGISFAGIIDVAAGLYAVLILLGIHSIAVYIFAIYLIQKAVLSIVA